MRLCSRPAIGSVISALCCFTPILAILLGAVGLAALVGCIDYVFMPALVIFIWITAYACFRKKRECKGEEGTACRL